MKSYRLVYMIIIISVFSCTIYSQKEKISITKKKDTNYSSVNPLKTYEKIIEKGYKSVDMLKKIGNAYYFNEELDKAAKWYGELFTMSIDLESEYYFRYAQSLKSINKNDEAEKMMKIFNQKTEVNTEIKN